MSAPRPQAATSPRPHPTTNRPTPHCPTTSSSLARSDGSLAVPLAAVRRVAIDAQEYAARRRTGTTAEVESAIRALSCVQLDSISTVDRSHRIALGARVGAHPVDAVSRLLRRGRLIEYWAHEACLLPAEDWPLLRPAMENGGRRWYGEVDRTHPHLREHVLTEIRARGPLATRDYMGAARKGEMWGW
jgi:uncharacterized protein YcaQ